MGIISVAAMAAIASTTLGSAAVIVDDGASAGAAAGCLFEPVAFVIDGSVGPVLVSTVAGGHTPPPLDRHGPWGQAALRPYDVMSSLGAGGSPQLPASLSPAVAPAPLTLSSPLAWVLATAGLLGMLYVRRTQL